MFLELIDILVMPRRLIHIEDVVAGYAAIDRHRSRSSGNRYANEFTEAVRDDASTFLRLYFIILVIFQPLLDRLAMNVLHDDNDSLLGLTSVEDARHSHGGTEFSKLAVRLGLSHYPIPVD